MPPKKREKYARREDAILHALELESQIMETKPVKLELREARVEANGRAKRNKCMYLQPNDNLDHKLTLQSQSGVVNCQSPHDSSTEGNSRESSENTEYLSATLSSNSETEDDMPLISGFPRPLEAGPRFLEKNVVRGSLECTSSDELYETEVRCNNSHLHANGLELDPYDTVSGDLGMSKWKLKRKRNTRIFCKTSVDLHDQRVPKTSILGKRPSSRSFGSYPKSGVGHNILEMDQLGWDDRSSFKVYRENLNARGVMKSMLIDVDLRVQASYQKEHVPIVSLMSRLNGKAIIGHPIQIIVLEDGLSQVLIHANDNFGHESFESDGNTELQPVWKTGRRTSNRAPHSNLFSVSDANNILEKIPFGKQKTPKNNLRMVHVPRPPKKLARKTPTCTQKIRTLSSIPIAKCVSGVSDFVGGLIKPESTTVECIPLKLVFSRLFEGVSKPPCRRGAVNGDL